MESEHKAWEAFPRSPCQQMPNDEKRQALERAKLFQSKRLCDSIDISGVDDISGVIEARLITPFGRSRREATIDPLISNLDRLARESGTTKAEVMVRAIKLYEKTLEEASKGNVIQFMPESELQNINFIASSAF